MGLTGRSRGVNESISQCANKPMSKFEDLNIQHSFFNIPNNNNEF